MIPPTAPELAACVVRSSCGRYCALRRIYVDLPVVADAGHYLPLEQPEVRSIADAWLDLCAAGQE